MSLNPVFCEKLFFKWIYVTYGIHCVHTVDQHIKHSQSYLLCIVCGTFMQVMQSRTAKLHQRQLSETDIGVTWPKLLDSKRLALNSVPIETPTILLLPMMLILVVALLFMLFRQLLFPVLWCCNCWTCFCCYCWC